MRFGRKKRFSVTGVSVNLPMIGGGVTWAENVDERSAHARTERAEAFKRLWRIAQEANIGIRNNFDNADKLADVHRQMNVLLIECAPAMDPEDVELAKGFLNSLSEFVTVLRVLPGEEADRVREDFALTLDEPPMLPEFEILDVAHARVSQANELLKQRYRDVVYGER